MTTRGSESADRDDDAIVVPQSLDGERVDRAIALLTGWSRAEVQALLREGEVLVGGREVGKSHRLRAGDEIDVLGAPEAPAVPLAEPGVTVEVRHADEEVIVVNKPAGLVVHPGAGHAHGTLVQGLLALFPELAAVGERSRPGIVHRLDRDTSGLLVVARTQRAHEHLVAALARRDVERDYLALVQGAPSAPRGVVDAPIGRSAQRRTRMAVRDAGRPARTTFEVVSAWPDAGVTLLSCGLETGRTHQIRVHLSAVGLPIVGDTVYGGPPRAGSAELDRPFLHAIRLEFPHPDGSGPRSFEEPLPAELDAVLRDLGPDALGPDALGPPAG
jgi:23S rRNA pseudouridine1911/1915/1917 synthase